jgi:hypothetical protein
MLDLLILGPDVRLISLEFLATTQAPLVPNPTWPRVCWGSAKPIGRAQMPCVRLECSPIGRGGVRKKLKGGQIKNIILKRLILSYFIQGRSWKKFSCRGRAPASATAHKLSPRYSNTVNPFGYIVNFFESIHKVSLPTIISGCVKSKWKKINK